MAGAVIPDLIRDRQDTDAINRTFDTSPYCIKRIFQPQKTFETKQMLIHFFDLKKGLFRLF
ncbi:hypothetical protein DWU89_10485 [Parabacteroides acidifaciens]|uniref:Uncharacterized protein n=1 Tax=Parabacteroides acidifaciens TaxID=2290935 RepID=A0A3D8HEK5_9BACT|nr:hypothetical protein DWU89_10485 [Parabacteroides acidifaciens]